MEFLILVWSLIQVFSLKFRRLTVLNLLIGKVA